MAVLQKLIKEGPESAQGDLHKYFLETCVDINESFNESPEESSIYDISYSPDSEHDVIGVLDANNIVFNKTHAGEGWVITADIPSEEVLSQLQSIPEVEVGESTHSSVPESDCSVSEDGEEDQDDTIDTDIEAVDGSDDIDIEQGDDAGDDSVVDIDAVGDASDVGLEDKVEDLESQLADLQAQFMALTGQGPLDSETVEIDPEDDSDTLVTTDDGGESPIDGSEEDGDEEEEEATDESMTFEDEDFADLEEAYQLEKVQDPNLSGGKEIGANGQKISVNDKSPTLQKKVGDRIGGEPVEVISDEHSGYDREPSPGVKDVTIAKNQQKKANQELKGVSKEGDKSALINKNDGFGADNTKSPVVPTKSLQK